MANSGVVQPTQPPVNEALVADLLKRKKFVHAVVFDNTQPSGKDKRKRAYVAPDEKRIVFEIRFSDSPDKAVKLRFTARLETPLTGLPRPRPGISLKWKGVRVRGVNYYLRHDSIRNGVSCGHIKYWHEKIFTNTDGDKYVIDMNDEVKNEDLWSLIRFCCKRWNIQLEDKQYKLGAQ